MSRELFETSGYTFLNAMITEFVVTDGERRKRLDQFLVRREPEISRSGLKKLIATGRIRVNGQIAKPGRRVKAGDRIVLDTPPPGPLLVNNRPLELQVLYEDDFLLVVDKPAGIVVHPTSGHWEGTLLNGLLAHLSSEKDAGSVNRRPPFVGLIHRLDKETSGAMVIAKTGEVHRSLSRQFEQQTIARTYEALVSGVPESPQGVITLAIGRDVKNPRKYSPDSSNPRHSVTEYQIKAHFGKTGSLVRMNPHTGRPHQLRVHLAWMGCPILGDRLYGGVKVGRVGEVELPRVMLHAHSIGFQHPVTGDYREYSSGFPVEMQTILDYLSTF